MSLISKLTTLGAAGSGGESYWVAEITSSTNVVLIPHHVKVDSNDNIICSALYDGGNNINNGNEVRLLFHVSSDGSSVETAKYFGDGTDNRADGLGIDANDDIYHHAVGSSYSYGSVIRSNSASDASNPLQKDAAYYFPTGYGNPYDFMSLAFCDRSGAEGTLVVRKNNSSRHYIKVSPTGSILFQKELYSSNANNADNVFYNPNVDRFVILGMQSADSYNQQFGVISVNDGNGALAAAKTVGTTSTCRNSGYAYDANNHYIFGHGYDGSAYRLYVAKYNYNFSTLSAKAKIAPSSIYNVDHDFRPAAAVYNPVNQKIYFTHITRRPSLLLFELNTDLTVSAAYNMDGIERQHSNEFSWGTHDITVDSAGAIIICAAKSDTKGVVMRLDPDNIPTSGTYQNVTFSNILSTTTVTANPTEFTEKSNSIVTANTSQYTTATNNAASSLGATALMTANVSDL